MGIPPLGWALQVWPEKKKCGSDFTESLFLDDPFLSTDKKDANFSFHAPAIHPYHLSSPRICFARFFTDHHATCSPLRCLPRRNRHLHLRLLAVDRSSFAVRSRERDRDRCQVGLLGCCARLMWTTPQSQGCRGLVWYSLFAVSTGRKSMVFVCRVAGLSEETGKACERVSEPVPPKMCRETQLGISKDR